MENENKTVEMNNTKKSSVQPKNVKLLENVKKYAFLVVGVLLGLWFVGNFALTGAMSSDLEKYLDKIQEVRHTLTLLDKELIKAKTEYEELRFQRDEIEEQMLSVERDGEIIRGEKAELELQISELINEAAGLVNAKEE